MDKIKEWNVLNYFTILILLIFFYKHGHKAEEDLKERSTKKRRREEHCPCPHCHLLRSLLRPQILFL